MTYQHTVPLASKPNALMVASRCTAPVVVDKKARKIVNNESR